VEAAAQLLRELAGRRGAWCGVPCQHHRARHRASQPLRGGDRPTGAGGAGPGQATNEGLRAGTGATI